MKTLVESFKTQLNIPEAQHSDPVVIEVLEHLSKMFQKAISDPGQIGAVHTLWEKIKNAPRVNGLVQIDRAITSEVTLDKIQKW